MSDLNGGKTATANDATQVTTARFNRSELVRGWCEREAEKPQWVLELQFGAKTDLGRIRENNEDKFEFYQPDDPTILATRGSLFAVADGMGGHAAGQIASEIALKNVLSGYYDSIGDDIGPALTNAMRLANETVYAIAQMIPERAGMGTTMTALALVENRAVVAHIGDSRAYLIRDGDMRQVTRDHSLIEEQIRQGVITRDEAEISPFRNVITRCIGTMPVIEPETFEEKVLAMDRWVLCTDGLTAHVEPEEICQIALHHAPSEACRQLVELANARGGRDNITLIIVHIHTMQPYQPSAS